VCVCVCVCACVRAPYKAYILCCPTWVRHCLQVAATFHTLSPSFPFLLLPCQINLCNQEFSMLPWPCFMKPHSIGYVCISVCIETNTQNNHTHSLGQECKTTATGVQLVVVYLNPPGSSLGCITCFLTSDWKAGKGPGDSTATCSLSSLVPHICTRQLTHTARTRTNGWYSRQPSVCQTG